MKGLTIVTFLLSLVLTIHGLRSRIHGGSAAPKGKFPYLVSLRTESNIHFCSGSIIDNRWILTAAHCLLPNFKIKVVAGTNSRTEGFDTAYNVEERIIHEAYDKQTKHNDIALARVDRDIKFVGNVEKIKLANKDTTADNKNDKVTFAGWGKYSDDSRPDRLHYFESEIITFGQCKFGALMKVYADTEICTLGTRGGGVCQGDSGGPVVKVDEGKIRQIGVISRKSGRCGDPNPDIHIKVYSFRKWINKKIGNTLIAKLSDFLGK